MYDNFLRRRRLARNRWFIGMLLYKQRRQRALRGCNQSRSVARREPAIEMRCGVESPGRRVGLWRKEIHRRTKLISFCHRGFGSTHYTPQVILRGNFFRDYGNWIRALKRIWIIGVTLIPCSRYAFWSNFTLFLESQKSLYLFVTCLISETKLCFGFRYWN